MEKLNKPNLYPVHEAVVKVASDCPLRCIGCYVYDNPSGDESWRRQPKLMSEATVDAVGGRLAEYLGADDTPPYEFTLTAHGGEPLLQPPAFYDMALGKWRSAIQDATDGRTWANFSMQTSGVGLTREHLEIFLKYSMRLGVSLDGDREANDRHRLLRGRNRASSYDKAVESLNLLNEPRYQSLFAGILAVIDLRNDPRQTYESLRQFNPPALDFLFPHGNYAALPPGLETQEAREQAPYGRWVSQAIDAWAEEDRAAVRLRVADSLFRLIGGGRTGGATLGTPETDSLIVIETDGSYEMLDYLTVVPGEVAVTGLTAYRNSIREAAEFFDRKARGLGAGVVAAACEGCPIVKICGSGDIVHRFADEEGREAGFNNPTVYCADVAEMTGHTYGMLSKQVIREHVAAVRRRSSEEV